MNIYFDESRNTGEISENNGKLNYSDQRYFVLVGYIDDYKLTKKYEIFVAENLKKIYKDNETEIKGNDLLIKKNNDILNKFMSEFLLSNNFLITIYDKRYFLTSQLLLWLFGFPFRDKYFIEFLKYCELLYKSNDIVFTKYLDIMKKNTFDEIKNYVAWLLEYDFKECISAPWEKNFLEDFKFGLKTMKEQEFYIQILQDTDFENVRISKKYRNNIVNLTALGETMLLYKLNNQDILNKNINIFHDEIEVVQDYIKHYWVEDNITFVKSEKNLQVQLADNVASIVGKAVNSILPISNDSDLIKKSSSDYKWQKELLNIIFNKISKDNIKIVTSMRENACMQALIENRSKDLKVLKLKIMSKLDERMKIELLNHTDINKAMELLKR